MATKINNYTKAELQNISKQLQCPEGTDGVFIAKKMSTNNMGMILSGMLQLDLKNNDRVLELGHGNGLHISKIHTMAHHLNYYGLDISPLMVNQAQENNKLNKNTSFNLYDGEQIIYKDSFFDKVFTINTIYFFKSPENVLNEIYRVLKPNGIFVLVFADKNFMSTLPFTQYGFQLYDLDHLTTIIDKTRFKITKHATKNEFVKSKLDRLVERKYHVIQLIKLD